MMMRLQALETEIGLPLVFGIAVGADRRPRADETDELGKIKCARVHVVVSAFLCMCVCVCVCVCVVFVSVAHRYYAVTVA
jgi:hypothetical protein